MCSRPMLKYSCCQLACPQFARRARCTLRLSVPSGKARIDATKEGLTGCHSSKRRCSETIPLGESRPAGQELRSHEEHRIPQRCFCHERLPVHLDPNPLWILSTRENRHLLVGPPGS